jgi:hypothetical protein
VIHAIGFSKQADEELEVATHHRAIGEAMVTAREFHAVASEVAALQA